MGSSAQLFARQGDEGPLDPLVTRATQRLRTALEEVDPQGRMADRSAICREFARTLNAASPRLPNRIEQVCERSAAATAEAVVRFAGDRAEIISILMSGNDPGLLTAIEPTAGDPHQGGRSVAFLRFADRAEPLVYKPRSVTSAAFYSRLVEWLNERLPELALATTPTLVKTGYGWAGFVLPAPCRTAADAERFYYRQGALLAILHAANGTDVHADNLIARGDQPVLVDTETLLHPVLNQPTLVAADPALVALGQSVHQTILLPTLLYGAEGAVDISGLGGRGDPVTHAAFPANRPVLNGKLLEPRDHIPALLRGFGDAYGTISRNADAFIELLESTGDLVTRLVARPTRTYAELLDDPAPDDANARTILDTLASAPTFEGSARLLEHEYRDLQNRDIPIFFARPDSRSIWTGRGLRVSDALEVSGLDSARAKVRAMSDAERRRQEWIIDAAFATATGPISHRSAAPVGIATPAAGAFAPLDPQWAVDQALDIARRLDELAYRSGGRVNWLSLEPFEDGYWRLLPAGGGLPHGYTGVALFLAQLGAITGRAEFLERAAEAVVALPALLESVADRPAHLASIGCGYAGMGGIVYALARLSTLLGSPDPAKQASAAIGLLARADAHDFADSYADGRAGAVVALRAVGRELGLPEAAELARVLAELPFPRAEGPVAEIDDADDGWCHGAAGAAAAGLLEPAALDAWLTRLAGTAPVSDLSLCHGELGVLDALTVLAPRHERAGEVLARRAAALPRAVEHGARLAGTPGAVSSPGLMHGLAGTGYGLLRTGFAEVVPSVLGMEPTQDQEFG
jgi:type 2 lantibiotic biosynthesis protein LanM